MDANEQARELLVQMSPISVTTTQCQDILAAALRATDSAAYERGVAAERERCARAGDALVAMIEAQGKVLVAYRRGARRPPGKALDTLEGLSAALEAWSAIRAGGPDAR